MTLKAKVFHDPLPPFQVVLAQVCWAFAAGRGTGAQVSLHFGRKLPRLKPVDNPRLQEDLRTHEGEAIVFIECRWSIRRKGRTLFDSESDIDMARRMLDALEQLREATVIEVAAKLPPTSVSLMFDNGSELALHSDMPDLHDPHDNFSLSFGESTFVIGPDLGLRVEARRGLVPLLGYASKNPARREKKGHVRSIPVAD